MSGRTPDGASTGDGWFDRPCVSSGLAEGSARNR
jgi:hypothetical protein